MKALVTKQLNRRIGSPSVNAQKLTPLEPGASIEIVKIVTGDKVDGNNAWYQTSEGYYVWCGGCNKIFQPPNPIIEIIQEDSLFTNPNFMINYNEIIKNIPDAWKLTGGKGINIAVLDTGVNATHIDFNGIFNQSNTIDFTSSPSGIEDVYNHGTLVSGIIGARTLLNSGIRGVVPESNLFILKVGDDNGVFLPTNIINAINWASSNKIDILNMSFGINYNYYRSIITTLNNIQNSIIVSSAGEDDILIQSNFLYPAMHPQIISVGAIKQPINGVFNKALNYILPLIPMTSCDGANQNTYKTESGSSMSTALLTGVIALYLSYSGKSNLQKSTIMQELDKYSIAYNNNIELNDLYIIKP
jgi:subtilisin family serine protease